MEGKKLTFKNIKIGSHFIDFPTDGDNSGHGGFKYSTFGDNCMMDVIILNL